MNNSIERVICINNSYNNYNFNIKINDIYYSHYKSNHIHYFNMIFDSNYNFVTALKKNEFKKLFKNIKEIREDKIDYLL